MLIILGIILVVLVLWFILTFNRFVKQKALVEEAFSGMDVYLKKRFDLIPNIIETVKGYVKHEESTLTKIVELRNKMTNCTTVNDKVEAQKELSQGISRLFALAENYPNLTSNTQFLSMQEKLSAIEDDISQARKYYNGAVKQYNILIETIPSNILAAIFSYKKYSYFEIEEIQRENGKVNFNDTSQEL